MKTNNTWRALTMVLTLAILFSLFSSAVAAAPAVPVSFTILHTNDFHGQLVGPPGSARVANYINGVRTAVGAANVLLVDAGDEMQGSLLSNMGDGTATGKGKPTIATYNAMGYNVATFGNHEFDWGQVNLANRTGEAVYPYVTANIVQNDTGNCSTAGWTPPAFADAPYHIITVGTDPNTVKVAFIGVTTQETPTITIATATAGLCFKDPAQSISHYYAAMRAAGANVIVVLSHLGNTDAGGGYGLPVYGDQTLAARLNTASTPVNLIIGGHSHTDLTSAQTVGSTKIVQAANNGIRAGRADITVGIDGSVTITWTRNVINNTDPQDPTINALVTGFASDPAYLALVSTPVGYSAVDLPRLGRVVDNMMGTFVDDAIYNYLNTDAEPSNDIDIFINNGGGIRTDWCWNGSDWVTTGCVSGTHAAGLLDYGDMFTVLPFGNATMVGQMTGAQILEVLNHGPEIPYVAQPAGLKYSYYKYSDANPGPQPYAWGTYDVQVYNKTTHAYEPLDLKKVYSVGTNEFLAPGGGDGYNAFKYMTNITSWGDMLNAVNAYVSATYGTPGTAYLGPNGNGTLDGRILRDGDGDTTFDGGSEIVPLTILHHNDSHGNLVKTPYIGYTQLAALIQQERAHNVGRTLLVSSGDNIQGDAMSYYFKTAPTGFTSNGTAITDPTMRIQPLIKAFNAMNYDAMTLGNHEFNFGSAVFTSVLSQATFPLLQANVAEDPAHPYGLAAANILPYVLKTVGGDINVAILGIGNHRIPNYELPSNIPGLTFSDPIAKAQELSTLLGPSNDVVIALTHIGFTTLPGSIEVDANVDTNLVANTTGIDAVIGGHSHSDPSRTSTYHYLGNYKYLPSIVADADGNPVVVTQALRYNNTLGEVVMGLRPLGGGNYEVVSQTGRYIQLCAGGRTGTSPYTTCSPDTAENAAIKAIIDPYNTMLTAYNNTVAGQTTAPIDTLLAFTQETNGANLQADAAVYELETVHGIPVDFHLSGAMTNKLIATGATPASPVTLKISDMFTAMPYENSLVVIGMNGPQLKTVLERAYRNYYYYKYVSGYGGYSYYTTCMLDTNFGNQITYNDLNPVLPNGHNVVSLNIGGVDVDFTDASTYYNVSTVNYLAAGSCNFNNAGVSLWPLNQIVADTQYYVRDAVIDYTTFMGTVSPAIEGRLQFVDNPALAVTSITRLDPSPTGATSVKYTLEFTEPVTGVDPTDFVVTAFGVYDANATNVTGFGTTYEVTVNTGNGNGSLRLDVSATAAIFDLGSNALVGGYTGGEVYLISKNAPVLLTPTDGEFLHENRPTFDWTDYPGAIGYQIQVSRDSLFSTQIIKPNIDATSAYTMTIDLPVNTILYWRVRARINAFMYSEWSNVWSMHTANPPGTPGLLSPALNALTTDLTPTLDWSQSVAPVGTTFHHYQLQVDDNADFSSPAVNVDVLGQANHVYTPLVNLNANTKYYWRVNAWNTAGDYSAWSAVRNFREAMLPPTLVAPIGGVVVGSLKPTFTWDVVVGAASYTLRVSKNAIFTQLVINKTVTGPTFTATTNLQAGTAYYWQVRVNGPNGPSVWSMFETFITP